MFIYVGSQVLEGGIPYVDVWDHKGPLIYYINALGLWLTGSSRWGVWLLEVLFATVASWLVLNIARKYLGRIAALFAAAAFVYGLQQVLHGGNFTEEYALPLQLGCIACFCAGMQKPQFGLFVLLGFQAALCFLLRPNIIGIPFVAMALLLHRVFIRKETQWAQMLGAAILGGLAVILAVSAYFWSQGAFVAMWDAMLRYNLIYAFLNNGDRLASLGFGFSLLGPTMVTALGGWVLLARQARQRGDHSAGRYWLSALLLFALPLELALTALPSRDYQHYFMSWLPVASLLAGVLATWLLQTWPRVGRLAVGLGALVLALFPLLAVRPALAVFQQAGGLPPVVFSTTPYQASLEYIYSHTAPEDTILFWGNNLSLQWISGRQAPTRLAYQSPLAVAGYVTPEMVSSFLAELQTNSPQLILDTTIRNNPLPALSQPASQIPSLLQPIYAYVAEHYTEAGELYQTEWVVYERLP
ncbi:MAG: glycosyltransferase family 39 protein [Anaerolineales bacterium]|nr:glycosyltransferase family 39 protein [Anaerolineales bacterium]